MKNVVSFQQMGVYIEITKKEGSMLNQINKEKQCTSLICIDNANISVIIAIN